MLSLTSSCKAVARHTSQGSGFKRQRRTASEHSCRTWELELKANLARAQAFERSMSSRKKGRASLEVKRQPFVIGRDRLKKWKERQWNRWTYPYLRPVSSLSRKWMTTVLNTKLENIVNRPAMPAREQRRDIYRMQSERQAKKKKNHVWFMYSQCFVFFYPGCIWTLAVSSSGIGSKYRRWRCIVWWSEWWCHCLRFAGMTQREKKAQNVRCRSK